MLRKLTHDKQVFEEDLYAYIPAPASSLFQINKAKDVPLFSRYFQQMEPVLLSVNQSVTYPLLITSSNNCFYVVAKVTTEQEQSLRKILSDVLFPSFSPKERMYKGTRILFYPTADNQFFACMFYNGIFVGGYNYEFLEQIIDISDNSDLFFDSSFQSLSKDLKVNYPVNLLFKENGNSFIFNGGFANNGKLEFTGYANIHNETGISNSDTHTDSISIDKEVLSDGLLSYSIDLQKSNLSDKFKSYFEAPFYKLEVDTLQKAPVFLFKYKVDRFDIFKELNRLESGYIGKKLSTKDVIFRKQHVYTTSKQLALYLFKEDEPVTISFYKGYMLYSRDRNALERYLLMREKEAVSLPVDNNMSQYKLSVRTIFRSNNMEASEILPYRSHFSIFSTDFSKINVTTYYLGSGRLKTEVLLNN